MMKRREFLAAMAASAIATASPSWAQVASRRPHLLIAETDPFTGLRVLKARYASGLRPSEDMEGWALSWQLTGREEFAERAIAEMKSRHVASAAKASRSWVDYARWSLAFDWLLPFRGFDSTLQARVAGELRDGAAAMLATPDFADPGQLSYHNYALRYLAMAAFPAAALEGHSTCDQHCAAWRETIAKSLTNVLEISEFVTPLGSYHESLDYMRITWASLVMLAELQRTRTGIDPAQHYSVFRNMGETYLYKLLPDGTPSREGDNEYPILDSRDTTVLGYVVNRFKDPYSAWLLRESTFCKKEWVLPVLEFLWNDPEVTPRNPALADEHELPRQRFFPGVGHLVMRDGWTPEATWIEFDCGAYFAKHQHLDQNQITIYHRGYLAIDSGADYTDTESPHYLNYYRRTVAHNSVLVYDPKENFFWSDNLLAAANDGGQRMNSSRYWNTIRSREDWERTRDLWDLGAMQTLDYVPGHYHYAKGDASKAYSRDKVRNFTREVLFAPGHQVLFVFDRVASTQASFRKAWLLHGVNQPAVDQESGPGDPGAQEFRNPKTFRFVEGSGELLVHSLLPKERIATRRGGSGYEFICPGDDHGGGWGSGENWPLEPAQGGPLPEDPKLRRMWKLFWGNDFDRILSSNRKNVVPGGWRIEISPSSPSQEDFFLHVMEIGDKGQTGKRRAELLDGVNFEGAAFERGPMVLFSSIDSLVSSGEVSLPDLGCDSLIITGLQPESMYEINFGGLNVSSSASATLPGVAAGSARIRANSKGILRIERQEFGNLRLRIQRIG
jgi:Heparinase II/III-like protein